MTAADVGQISANFSGPNPTRPIISPPMCWLAILTAGRKDKAAYIDARGVLTYGGSPIGSRAFRRRCAASAFAARSAY